MRTVTRLEWPVRTLSFSYDSQFLAAGSEDQYIDIAEVSSGEQVQSRTRASRHPGCPRSPGTSPPRPPRT
jgi:WD40 repeat protein